MCVVCLEELGGVCAVAAAVFPFWRVRIQSWYSRRQQHRRSLSA